MPDTSIPDTMHALEMRGFGPASKLQLTDARPVPRAGTSHSVPDVLCPVLVKVEWAALNPMDAFVLRGKARMVGLPRKLPHVLGCDFAGTVAELPPGSGADASQAHNFKVGDRVFGSVSEFHHNPAPGTLAQYVSAPADVLAKVPDGTPLAEASTLGCCGVTAALGVFKHLGLRKGYSAEHAHTSVLVYGASTTVGHFAVQLAKHSGYRVVGVASKQHHAYLVATLRVDAVFDYSDPDFVQQLAADPANRGLALALDAVGSVNNGGGGSVTKRCFEVLRACSGAERGKVATVDPFQPGAMLRHRSQLAGISELTAKCPDQPKGLLGRLASGIGGGGKKECVNGAYMQELGARLAAGQLVCARVRKLQGLEAGGKEGLQLLADGALSGQKAVVHVAAG